MAGRGRRFLHVTYYPYEDESERILGGIVSARDLTELKEAEEKLKNSVSHLSTLMDNTDDYIYFKNRDHVFTGASQTLVEITEQTERWTDLLGKTDYDVFPREFADIYYTLEKQIFSGEVPMAQAVQPTLDQHGNRGWVDNRHRSSLQQ